MILWPPALLTPPGAAQQPHKPGSAEGQGQPGKAQPRWVCEEALSPLGMRLSNGVSKA